MFKRLIKRDSWPQNDEAVRLSILVGKRIVEHRFGWTGSQWQALYALWAHESGWRWWAYGGIPQFRPASKGRGDFATNPITQIRQGGFYIVDRWHTPLGACQGDCWSGSY